MSTETGLLVGSVFLASAVEMVEAATIVLAIGFTRGWRGALLGVGAGLVVLAALVTVLGPALTLIPIGVLRLVVGGLLLIFGLQWLRKAILRASGLKALHDEQASFREERERARQASIAAGGLDTYGFTVSFKGVVLEGLEVVFIVITFGSTQQHQVGLAAIAAVAAVLVVLVAVLAIRAPLSRVPENTMKFVVGAMLTSFGTFWGAEGAGVAWPGSDAALLVIIPVTVVVSLLMVAALRRGSGRERVVRAGAA